MIKVMVLLKKRADFTDVEFREYYERRHAVLAASIIPSFERYTRNYVRHETIADSRQVGGPRGLAFDVITELCFDTVQEYDDFRAAFADPENLARIQADEANLFDPSTLVSFIVDERSS